MPSVFESIKVSWNFNSALQQVPEFNNILKKFQLIVMLQQLFRFYWRKEIKLRSRSSELIIFLKINKYSLCMMSINSLIHWILYKEGKKLSRKEGHQYHRGIIESLRQLFLIQFISKHKTSLLGFLRSLLKKEKEFVGVSPIIQIWWKKLIK